MYMELKKTYRFFGKILIALMICIAVLGGGHALAADTDTGQAAPESYVKTDEESSEMSGIRVTMKTDKDSYKAEDKAVISLEVTNTNRYDVTDVKLQYNLPSNIKKAGGDTLETIEKLAAGETCTLKMEADVTEDTAAPLSGAAITRYVIIGIAAVLVILFVVIFLFAKRRRSKKVLSVFLAAVLLCGSIGNGPVAVSEAAVTTETGNYEVDAEEFTSRVSVHDPSIVKDPKSGMYYIFGSHRAFAKSKDLMKWESFGTNIGMEMNTLFKHPWGEWAGTATTSGTLSGMMWAPDVIWNETMQKWCMYMSINGDNWVSSICLLTADDIEGPYEYKGVVVYSGMNNPNKMVDESKTDIYKVLGEGADLSRYASTNESCVNAIDPNIQEDENGDLYMTYGSWSAGIYQLKLDKTTGLRDYNTKYETKQDVSDAYLGTKIAGGYYCSGEGPYLLKSGKYYYLFLSYANLEAMGGYQMRIFRSENIAGPYVDQNGVSAIRDHNEDVKMKDYGYRIFGSYDMYGLDTVQVAQGHNSAFVDDDGKIFLVYHTRFQSNTGTSEFHQVRVHQMFVNTDGWLVAAPYEYTGETISEEGYAMEDMAGTYEFIYHEPTSYYKVVGDKQYGIVGKGDKIKKIKGESELVAGDHISKVGYSVEFTQNEADRITLHSDGTVSGEYHGTWTYDKSGMTIDLGNGNVYKGVFLKQANETLERTMTMTFTAEGNNVAVWGVKCPEDVASEKQ